MRGNIANGFRCALNVLSILYGTHKYGNISARRRVDTEREHTHSQTSLSNGKLKRVCWLWWWLECGPSIRRVVIRNGILKDPRAHTHTINMARVWGDGCVDVFSSSGAEICTNKNSTIYIYVCRYYLQ